MGCGRGSAGAGGLAIASGVNPAAGAYKNYLVIAAVPPAALIAMLIVTLAPGCKSPVAYVPQKE
jgi:hypothetical protein